MARSKKGIVKKVTLIEKVRKSVFVWVALSSCVISACIMGIIFLGQIGIFNSKVIKDLANSEKQAKSNVNAISDLEGGFKSLNTNKDLASVKSSDSAQPLQTILDALPTEANSLALGSSIEQKLISGIRGLKIDSLDFTSINQSDPSQNAGLANSDSGVQYQTFAISASGEPDSIKSMLRNFERSIRAIDIKSIAATGSDNGNLTVNVEAEVPYLPPAVVELKTKKIEG